MRKRLVAALLALSAPLGAQATQRESASLGGATLARVVRVAIASVPYEAPLAARGEWVLRDAWGRVHANGRDSPGWRIERRNRRVRGVSGDGRQTTAWSDEPFTIAATGEGTRVAWGKHHYRGVLLFVPTDTAILVVNQLDLEDYLRGVVPLEIGVRSRNDSAAVQAQAIAARSYTVVRVQEGTRRPFDLTGSANDQVYGGVDAEHPMADEAIAATTGLVLMFGSRVVRAPYHSTCGGQTAAPSEVWRGGGDESYLRSVSDGIPGSDRSWCDISPKYRWDRSFDRAALEDAVARYARTQNGGATQGGGSVQGARIVEQTRSGRAGTLVLDTDAGVVRLEGNEIRYALRAPSGEILYSTYFALEPVVGRDGRLMQLTLHGRGNGHGIGMCQWGAIGRARAGHDVHTILSTYYPGTQLARLP